jgi:hypothetical protein
VTVSSTLAAAGRRVRRSPFMPALGVLALWAASRGILVAQLPGYTPHDDSTMGITLDWSNALLAGHSPYPGLKAYPPLAMFSFVLPGLTRPGVDTYKYTFAAAMLLVDLGGLALATYAQRVLARRHAVIAYLVVVPLMGSILLLWRYDLTPAVLSLAALVAVLRGRPTLAWAALGAGIAFKPYLLVLVPLFGAYELRRRAPDLPRRLGRALLCVVVPSALALVLMLPFAPLGDLADAYAFQFQRPPSADAVPTLIASRLDHRAVNRRILHDRRCGCLVKTGPGPRLARVVGTIILVLGLIALFVLVWRRPDAEEVVLASVAALALLLLTSAVYSPQYLVWLAPAVLLAGSRPGRLALGGVALASGLVNYSYRHGSAAATNVLSGSHLLYGGRILGQLVALGAVAWALARRPA